jgi:hypothetical protein
MNPSPEGGFIVAQDRSFLKPRAGLESLGPPRLFPFEHAKASAALAASCKRAPEELTVISCRWDGKKLEAESSGLFAQAHLSSLLCLFITTVEDGF